jgi:hypothetical protein
MEGRLFMAVHAERNSHALGVKHEQTFVVMRSGNSGKVVLDWQDLGVHDPQ